MLLLTRHLEVVTVLIAFFFVVGYTSKCDQTPPRATVLTPSENNGIFELSKVTRESEGKNSYLPHQTYVLILKTNNRTRPFRSFMITAEDPDIEESSYENDQNPVDVGNLKTLDEDTKSRYSERCISSVENTDNSDKYSIEIHWVSPKQSESDRRVRIRAMVAENDEVWYEGEGLTIILEKDNRRSIDSPPYQPVDVCNLCSEARYEIIFTGGWSRGSHPRHYPSKPDDNGYSHMIGASHAYNFTLWRQGVRAGEGLKALAEDADISVIEREIIDAMTKPNGTRTLIRGKRRHHPQNMHKPSYSLLRVDRTYHLFSVAVAMKPSPDWFLGTSRFELCTDHGWLEHSKIPLYPWDAGTVNGISYESPKVVTLPVENVERVAVGSFDKESPFYQMNLGDMKPFAHLEVFRLDVYPIEDDECSEDKDETQNVDEQSNDGLESELQAIEEPVLSESRQEIEIDEQCHLGDCIGENGLNVPQNMAAVGRAEDAEEL